ncbi:diacylglycerol kinase family protein [Janibacter cremeus]|uniref:diacylglycerol/lipid kinase family protein n=1 Tax=Janibacter cremeus TaxID=1285192 RepID=UPI0023F678FF|nr:diacylglycerol kinase family protein [Janibacter cremeus]WEV77592.1 diacylglycerol kinase family protein [Janibacter cremeus]
MSDWTLLALAVALCLILIGIAFALVLMGPGARRGRDPRPRPERSSFRRTGAKRTPRRAGIIINPTKFDDVAAVRQELTEASRVLDWAEPLFIETTIEDPGTGQARVAIEEGVDVVCPLGGDGTIRAVAVALAGTRTPMGLLPRGTGNLLARNLDIPFGTDITEALRVACSGRNKAIDVGWLELDPVEEPATEDTGQAEEPIEGPPVDRHPFLVMAGMGLDAEIMSGTSEELKNRVGWTAYFVTGGRKLFVKRFRVRWSIDGREQPEVQARTILFGNCGTLQGGLQLLPDAAYDDGLLDAVVVAPKTILGWGSVAVRVIGRSRKDAAELIRTSGRTYTAEVDEPRPVQVDGDVIGEASRMRLTVDHQAVIVRVAGTD